MGGFYHGRNETHFQGPSIFNNFQGFKDCIQDGLLFHLQVEFFDQRLF